MTIHLSLSAPEHSHLIVNYHEVFPEHNAFPLNWDCSDLPRPGDILDYAFVHDLVAGLVNVEMLPKIWQIMDIKWIRSDGSIVPVLNVVGK
jgi:hypothetical protein